MKKLTLGLLLLPALSIITLNATCPGGCPVMSHGNESYDDYQDMGYMGHQMEMDEFQQPMMHPLFELWMTLREKVHRVKALVQHIDEVKQAMKENKDKLQMSKEQYEKKMQLWNSFKKHIKEAAGNLKDIHTMMKKHMNEMRAKMQQRPMPRRPMGPTMQRQMAPKKPTMQQQKPVQSEESEKTEAETSQE